MAGTVPGFAGDGGPAVAAQLDGSQGVAIAADGSTLIADTRNSAVRRVAPNGIITTIAGTTTPGFSGDGGPATAAELDSPTDVAVLADGSVLVSDTGNNRVRRIAPDGTIITVAGSTRGLSGDGGLAIAAQLDARAAHGDADGGFLIADSATAASAR